MSSTRQQRDGQGTVTMKMTKMSKLNNKMANITAWRQKGIRRSKIPQQIDNNGRKVHLDAANNYVEADETANSYRYDDDDDDTVEVREC